MTAPTKELKMKPNRNKDYGKRRAWRVESPARPVHQRREDKHQQDKEFIKAMNEFTAKAGLLSDDPFLEGFNVLSV
jgi:antitoxin CcdA